MRWILAAAILTLVAFASARPAAAEPAHPEYAVRAGIHSTVLEFSDDAPAGKGPLLELGVGWRFNSWLSVGVFGAVSRLRDSFGDPFENKTYTSTILFFDLGLRFSLHWGGAFAGLGLGAQERREGSRWQRGTIGELHVGYRFPIVSAIRCAPEIVATVGRSTTAYDEFIETARLAVGVVF